MLSIIIIPILLVYNEMRGDEVTGFHNDTQKALKLDNYGDLMTANDLSAYLGISKQTVYKEIRDGKFGTPLKFGREYRIPKIYIMQQYLHA